MGEDYAHFITQAIVGWRNQALERIIGMDPRTHHTALTAITVTIEKVMSGVDKMTETDARIARLSAQSEGDERE